MLAETRSIKYDKDEDNRYLAIEYELFRLSGSDDDIAAAEK